MQCEENGTIRVEIKLDFPPVFLLQAAELYAGAEWISSVDEAGFLKKALENSTAVAAAYDCNNRLVGMGRAISDGVSDAYIQDVVVAPDFRKQGIGGKIVKQLVAELQSRGIDWIGLVGVPGTEKFYASLGFEAQEGHTLWLFK